MTLLDGIFETSRGLARRETPRAVIVPVFTDGIEFTNRYSNDVVKALQEQDVALHMVTIGQFYHSEEHSTRERSFLLDAGPRGSGDSASRCSARMGSMTRCNGWRVSCLRSTRSCTDARSRSLLPSAPRCLRRALA